LSDCAFRKLTNEIIICKIYGDMSDVTQTYRDRKKDGLQKMIFPGLILHGRQRYSSFVNRGFPNENRMFP